MIFSSNFYVPSATGDNNFSFAEIRGFRGDKYFVNLDVFFFNDLEDELSSGAFQSYQFAPRWDSTDNIFVQGEAYLKTLPMFVNASVI